MTASLRQVWKCSVFGKRVAGTVSCTMQSQFAWSAPRRLALQSARYCHVRAPTSTGRCNEVCDMEEGRGDSIVNHAQPIHVECSTQISYRMLITILSYEAPSSAGNQNEVCDMEGGRRDSIVHHAEPIRVECSTQVGSSRSTPYCHVRLLHQLEGETMGVIRKRGAGTVS